MKEKIESLRKTLNQHNYNYYVLNNPTISDYEFDMLMRELENLEKKHPEFSDDNSPTKRVGSDLSNEFNEIEHRRKMLSIENAYSFKELEDFDKSIIKTLGYSPEYICELKYDGASKSTVYENNKLSYSVSRGDGIKGEDITENVKTIKTIPLEINIEIPSDFEVRGEVILPYDAFEKANIERIKEIGKKPFENCRNAASGTLKNKHSKKTAKIGLEFRPYFIISDDPKFNKTQSFNMEFLKTCGFKIDDYRIVGNLDKVKQFINRFETERKNLPFDIDGIVIKINDISTYDKDGYATKYPKWVIAYKYPSVQIKTKLLSIKYQTGRTGKITPVAKIQTVLISGSNVKSATLHNADEIQRLDLHEGDTVILEKGGEIIPKITGVDISKRLENAKKIVFPTHCLNCGTKLINIDANHFCKNDDCSSRVLNKIEHFCKCLEIQEISDKTIDLLYENDLLSDITDIFRLQDNFDEIISLPRMGEDKLNKILSEIEKSKKQPFENVLYALGIHQVGRNGSQILAKHFKNINMLSNATFDELKSLKDVGDVTAQSIINWFENEDNLQLINELSEFGLQMKNIEKSGLKLSGIQIAFTGSFSTKEQRGKMIKLAIENGAKEGKVNKTTNYLVVGSGRGDSESNKLQEAKKNGTKIITEEEFFNLLK